MSFSDRLKVVVMFPFMVPLALFAFWRIDRRWRQQQKLRELRHAGA